MYFVVVVVVNIYVFFYVDQERTRMLWVEILERPVLWCSDGDARRSCVINLQFNIAFSFSKAFQCPWYNPEVATQRRFNVHTTSSQDDVKTLKQRCVRTGNGDMYGKHCTIAYTASADLDTQLESIAMESRAITKMPYMSKVW